MATPASILKEKVCERYLECMNCPLKYGSRNCEELEQNEINDIMYIVEVVERRSQTPFHKFGMSKEIMARLRARLIWNGSAVLDNEDNKRGYWIKKEDDDDWWLECSRCGYEPQNEHIPTAFCCNCGAEMDDYNDLVRSCETCNHYNVNTSWCSRYNDTTYSSNCSSYQVAEVQPVSVIRDLQEHIKQRILETAFNNGGIYGEVAEDIADRIDIWVDEFGRTENRWINARENPPKIGEQVLVCDKFKQIDKMTYKGNGLWSRNDFTYKVTEKLFWQPLPEPPLLE